jgi:hypothetical protein
MGKSSIGRVKYANMSSKNNENRKSLALPDMFSDLQNVQLNSALNKTKKSNKNSTISKRNKGDGILSDLKNHGMTTN